MNLSRREIVAMPAALTVAAAPKSYLMFVGTYTRDASKGIYAFRFEPEAGGKLTDLGLAAETPNPSFLTIHPNERFLYAVSEVSEFRGQVSGAVTAFAIDRANGKLKALNTVPSSGTSPCHLVVDKTQKNLIVVNYSSGSTTVLRVNADGSLGDRTGFVQHTGSGPNRQRQEGPHAHSINLSASNRWAIVADLGLDEFIVYRFDAQAGTIERHSAAKVRGGLGPRHFSFHPNGKLAYGLNEMGQSVTAFQWDEAKGTLTETQTISTLPDDYKGSGNSCAEVLVHPNGRFVYASNRGHNSLAIFSIDEKTGKLTRVGNESTRGEVPRNFRIDPTGGYIVCGNQNSANAVVFKVDTTTGKLTPGQEVKVPFPVCFRFL